jgi:4-hydroxy-tetrahydrodipicolinate synthase
MSEVRRPDEVTVYNMIATPFDANLRIDIASLEELADRMCRSNVGIYLGSGGAGEGHTLSVGELRQLYRAGVAACAGRVPVAANPREPRTATEMLELATVAAEEGVDVVQLYCLDAGHGMVPTAAELERYYRFILDRLEHPVALSLHMYYRYQIPAEFVADLCATYAQIEAINVIQPIDSFLDVQDAIATRGVAPRLYSWMGTLVEGLYAGSHGFLAAEPNIIPATMRSLTDAILTGDYLAAAELYVFAARFRRIVEQWAPSTARWVKMALQVLHLPGGNGVLREPYCLPGAAELASMRRQFDALAVEEVEWENAMARAAG